MCDVDHGSYQNRRWGNKTQKLWLEHASGAEGGRAQVWIQGGVGLGFDRLTWSSAKALPRIRSGDASICWKEEWKTGKCHLLLVRWAKMKPHSHSVTPLAGATFSRATWRHAGSSFKTVSRGSTKRQIIERER